MILNDHNVYILGAGFSCESGLPLVRGFLDRMRDSVEWLSRRNRDWETDAIGRVLHFRLRAASAAYRSPIDVENVEELFSLMSAAGGKTSEAQDMRIAIAATLDYCADVFQPTHMPAIGMPRNSPLANRLKAGNFHDINASLVNLSSEKCIAYRWPVSSAMMALMMGVLCTPASGSRNTVISFNYDLLAEDALRRFEIPFSYGLGVFEETHPPSWLQPGAETKLLKLHGSMNWRAGPDPLRDLIICPSYSELVADKAAPVLVPPTWRKEFVGPINNVWDEAIKAIECATRIVVIGFSIPETDVHFRYLLAAGLMANISLRKVVFIDPNAGNLRIRANSVLRQELAERNTIEYQALTASGALLNNAPLRTVIGRHIEPGCLVGQVQV